MAIIRRRRGQRAPSSSPTPLPTAPPSTILCSPLQSPSKDVTSGTESPLTEPPSTIEPVSPTVVEQPHAASRGPSQSSPTPFDPVPSSPPYGNRSPVRSRTVTPGTTTVTNIIQNNTFTNCTVIPSTEVSVSPRILTPSGSPILPSISTAATVHAPGRHCSPDQFFDAPTQPLPSTTAQPRTPVRSVRPCTSEDDYAFDDDGEAILATEASYWDSVISTTPDKGAAVRQSSRAVREQYRTYVEDEEDYKWFFERCINRHTFVQEQVGKGGRPLPIPFMMVQDWMRGMRKWRSRTESPTASQVLQERAKLFTLRYAFVFCCTRFLSHELIILIVLASL